MKKITFLFSAFMMFFVVNIHSQQETSECGTTTSQIELDHIKSLLPTYKEYEKQFLEIQQLRSSTVPTSIPVKVHIIRTSQGTGGLTETQLNDAFALMNSYYNNALMDFFICDGINYIDDSTYYNFEQSEEAALTAAHNVSGLINIYFTDNVVNDSGNSLCGYAYFPGGPDVILMRNSCAINGSTLIHEMGHFFSLIHTHGPDNSTLTTELVDGSNCSTNGDLICDTPADPQLSYSNVNTSCIYTGNATDANGDTFVPDPTNFMSYSRKECRDTFSVQQLARIYAAFQSARNYFECPSLSVDIAADENVTCENSLTVSFTDNSVGATSWQWDIDGDDIVDYTTQNPSHSYTSSGNYDVNLKISDGTNTIAKTFVKYIKVGTEESLPVNEDFNDITIVSEINWTAKDQGNGFAWIINSSGTPSPNTGPTGDSSGSGRYIYTEASGSNFQDTAELISNCIEVNSENATLEFDYHMFGGSMGVLHIDIDSGSGFVNDVIPAIIGQQQTTQTDAYLTGEVDLAAYSTQNIRIRFRAVRGNGFQSDIALDNILISGDLLSVDSFELNQTKIYPNPVNDSVLFIETNTNSELSFKINNILGQEINSGIISKNEIEVSNLAAGTYFLTLTSEDSKIIKKFIKQ